MDYRTITNPTDARYGLKRLAFCHEGEEVNVCIEADAPEFYVLLVLGEVDRLPHNEVEGLMTLEALSAYIGATKAEQADMETMEIGSKYRTTHAIVTRVSSCTYNGRWLNRATCNY